MCPGHPGALKERSPQSGLLMRPTGLAWLTRGGQAQLPSGRAAQSSRGTEAAPELFAGVMRFSADVGVTDFAGARDGLGRLRSKRRGELPKKLACLGGQWGHLVLSILCHVHHLKPSLNLKN